FAANSGANFGIKGALAISMLSSAVFGFEVPTRACCKLIRNFKSTALERSTSAPFRALRNEETITRLQEENSNDHLQDQSCGCDRLCGCDRCHRRKPFLGSSASE